MQIAATISPSKPSPAGLPDASEWPALMASQATLIVDLQQQISALIHQLDWFKRQIFGSKSERFIALNPQQMLLPAAPSSC